MGIIIIIFFYYLSLSSNNQALHKEIKGNKTKRK